MPPSPRLSARMMKPMYLMLITMISDQKTSESTPKILSGVAGMAWFPWKASRRA